MPGIDNFVRHSSHLSTLHLIKNINNLALAVAWKSATLDIVTFLNLLHKKRKRT